MIDSIKELYYSHSNGRSRIEYDLMCQDTCTLTVKPSWMDDEEGIVVEVDSKDVDRILRILQDHDVSSWDGFSKSDKNVLDGDGFSFKVVTKNNQSIYADGYMKFPKYYFEVVSELKTIFNDICDKTFLPLFEHESLKGFSIDDVSKIIIDQYGEGGLETEEVEDSEEILRTYNQWKDASILKECKMACEDNTTVYRFIMKDGKEYKIEKECNWLVFNNKRYYYRLYPFD